MDRRSFLQTLTVLIPWAKTEAVNAATLEEYPRWKLSESEWRKKLSPEAFAVLRREATERPYSSALYPEKRTGIYQCAGCNLPLFSSTTKYDSGTGWPSFWDALPNALETRLDFRLLLPRTEYHCKRCGGHQGHRFNDGPKPTGYRYCNNGVALTFQPKQ
ncbi:MAG: peptide-methionine (R)-S-oxide reductase MsrB [Cyanobacteriota bacterium]